jgi:hypothetical protein
MNKDSQRTRQKKNSESLRKSRTNPRRSTQANVISSQLPHQSQTHSEQSTNHTDQDFLNVFIGNLTSDNDDTRAPSTSNETPLTTKPPRTSKRREKPNRLNTFDEKYDSIVRRKSVGEQRREQLTQDYFEFYQNSNINYIHDNLTNTDKRKQYSKKLW